MRLSSLELTGALCALASAVLAYDCPFETCSRCLPDTVRHAPGVGVELTDTYAAVSLNYYNGSVSDLGLIPASPAYTALFTRLSLSPVPPPSDWLSHRCRKLNKFLHRPSTPDVAILAALLTSTRDYIASSSLTHPLPKIAITFPPIPALSWQDVHEALALAGLDHWTSLDLPYPRFIPSPGATLAARGEAICTEWRNLYACTDERLDGDLPLQSLLSVSLTNASLLTTVSRVNDAFTDTLAPFAVHSAAPHLGLDHLPARYDNDDGDDDDGGSAKPYWAAVRDHIAILPREAAARSRPITALALQGPGGALPELQNAIKGALGPGNAAIVERATGQSMPPAVWAAARGAALYARRRQEAPADCEEDAACYAGARDAPDEYIFGRVDAHEQRIMAR